MCNYFGKECQGIDRGYISPMLEQSKSYDTIEKSTAYQKWLMEASQDVSVKSKPKYPDDWLTQDKIDNGPEYQYQGMTESWWEVIPGGWSTLAVLIAVILGGIGIYFWILDPFYKAVNTAIRG